MLEITDAHFHIWDLDALKISWLDSVPTLKRTYYLDDLAKAYAFPDVIFNGGAYIEVNADDPAKEDAYIYSLDNPLIKAKLMYAHLCKNMRLPLGIAGVREPLHVDSSPKGRCLEQSFIEGLKLLSDHNLIFESCNRIEELMDLYKAAATVPEAKIVLNHCGNVTTTLTKNYKEAMQALAKLPNVYCKVSGYPTEDKNFVHELLDFITATFNPTKLLYASNFPVITTYSSLAEHLSILREYFHDDPDFFSKNAKKLYKINKVQTLTSVIRLRPDKASRYKKLHANPFPSVNKMIRDCGITDYRIFNRDDLLFSIMSYAGDDYQYDMQKMDNDPETNRWWKETDPCQMRIADATKKEWWADMEMVYDLNKKTKGDQ